MKRNAAKAGLALLAASGLVPGLTGSAIGGDRALIGYLGYSGDGRYFAFEEFGIQDGSGFPYSTIYIVDLAADAWVEGSPYRILLEDEEADVVEARDTALEQAEAKLESLEIDIPAFEIAHHADGETGDAHRLEFGTPRYGLEPPQDLHVLELETFPAPSPEDCTTFIGEEALGFALSLDGEEVHRDTGTLPRSRGCPLDYRIHAVVTLPEWNVNGSSGSLAVIASHPFGFEGADRRFLVVPLGQ